MREDSEHNKRLIYFSRLLFVIYMAAAIYILFVSEKFGRTTTQNFRYNLTPFVEIKRFAGLLGTRHTFKAALNLAGNIAVLMPMAFYIAFKLESKRMLIFKVTFECFVFSVLIELIQLTFKIGIFDIDDIILNTFGGLIAVVIIKIYYRKRD